MEKSLKGGTRPERIGFISFTRKAVNEARDRAILRFNLGPDRFPYFRTLHSLAFRQMGLTRSDVMTREHYHELGKALGIEIRGYRALDQEIGNLDRGDQAIFIESLSRLRCKELEETWSSLFTEITWHELKLVAEALVKFKRSESVLDFTDMMTQYYDTGAAPKLDILFVDEAQDLCQLQWRIIQRLEGSASKTYIAGDDDQAIFHWSGADVRHFIALKGRAKILRRSYRVPKEVYRFSQGIAHYIHERRHKTFHAAEREGSVAYYQGIEDIDLSQGRWLILIRNTFLEDRVSSFLRHGGYFYESFRDSPKRYDALRAAILWEDLRVGRSINLKEAKFMFRFMDNKSPCAQLLPKTWRANPDESYSVQQATRDKMEIWHRALTKISAEEREYFIACLRRGERLRQEPRIRISTIHGAKGGECQHVILFTDMSMRTWKAMQLSPDDEYRVFYVGATRAIETLSVIMPQSKYYFPI
jgi:DNA helicase-2/ATP-dependent DNA helicase PcrA